MELERHITKKTIMRSLCVATTIVSLISVVILFCDETSFVAGAGANQYRYRLCEMTPSRIDKLLSKNCVKRRKRRARAQSDENILQSPEKARSFLRRTTKEFVTNYVLFMEECCWEGGCRVEEIMEHCVVSY
ncbi:hypothetical protein OS493_022758 [Desmophyllum pertusum]|uniref:Insulin-like domain-containing protein n=1 Tax=Desmophyllum pertusum TaxID=174260 RepID=A0A9W9YDX6_9CNID|nr:hypothetical protein OS493_022758 [Desmophyllum pertusum]